MHFRLIDFFIAGHRFVSGCPNVAPDDWVFNINRTSPQHWRRATIINIRRHPRASYWFEPHIRHVSIVHYGCNRLGTKLKKELKKCCEWKWTFARLLYSTCSVISLYYTIYKCPFKVKKIPDNWHKTVLVVTTPIHIIKIFAKIAARVHGYAYVFCFFFIPWSKITTGH